MGQQQGGHRKHLVTPMAITLPHQTQWTFSTGTHVEEENMLSYMGIDFLVRRLEDKTTGNE